MSEDWEYFEARRQTERLKQLADNERLNEHFKEEERRKAREEVPPPPVAHETRDFPEGMPRRYGSCWYRLFISRLALAVWVVVPVLLLAELISEQAPRYRRLLAALFPDHWIADPSNDSNEPGLVMAAVGGLGFLLLVVNLVMRRITVEQWVRGRINDSVVRSRTLIHSASVVLILVSSLSLTLIAGAIALGEDIKTGNDFASGEIPWWGWLLAVLGLILAIYGVTARSRFMAERKAYMRDVRPT